MAKKKILIPILVILICFIASFIYFSLKVQPLPEQPEIELPEKEKLSPKEKIRLEGAEKTLTEWLPTVLKEEWLPQKLEIKKLSYLEPFKVPCLFECSIEADPNLYKGEWKISDKTFGAYVDYNNKKDGINYYLLTLNYFEEKKDLNKNLAEEILGQYLLSEPEIDFCFSTTKIKETTGCRGEKIKPEKETEDFMVFLVQEKQGEKRYVILTAYYLRPPESEIYEEKMPE